MQTVVVRADYSWLKFICTKNEKSDVLPRSFDFQPNYSVSCIAVIIGSTF